MNMPSPSTGTHHGRVPGFLPMSPADGLDQFRVTGTMAVRAMLRELQNAREHVVLYSADDDALHLVTRVEGLEAQDFRLTMAGSEAKIKVSTSSGVLLRRGVRVGSVIVFTCVIMNKAHCSAVRFACLINRGGDYNLINIHPQM